MHSNSLTFALRLFGKKRISTLAAVFGATLAISSITSCSNSQNPSNQQLQQKTARTTEKAKQDSKEALRDARIAAANAEQKVNAIASGIQQGIHEKAGVAAPGPGSRVDLNTASENDLTALQGISSEKARQIIRHRPYTSAHQLVGRGLLSQSQFDRISTDITVR